MRDGGGEGDGRSGDGKAGVNVGEALSLGGETAHAKPGRLEARCVVDVREPRVEIVFVTRLEEVLASCGCDEAEDVVVLGVGLQQGQSRRSAGTRKGRTES